MFKFEDVTLVTLPNEVLRKKSENVPLPLTKEDDLLIQIMMFHVQNSQEKDTKFQPAVGVAAVQYGILKNIFYILVKDENENIIFDDALVNPKMKGHSDSKAALGEGEGCLSVDQNILHQEGYVPRYSRVIIEAYSYKEKKIKTFDVINYVAIVMQHEYDHLQGKLFIDHIDKKEPWHLPKNTEVLE